MYESQSATRSGSCCTRMLGIKVVYCSALNNNHGNISALRNSQDLVSMSARDFLFQDIATKSPKVIGNLQKSFKVKMACWVGAITFTANPVPPWTSKGPDDQIQSKGGRKQEIHTAGDLCCVPGGGGAFVAVSTLHRVCWVGTITFTVHRIPPWMSLGLDNQKQRKGGRKQEILLEVDLCHVRAGRHRFPCRALTA